MRNGGARHGLTAADVADASARLTRFAAYIRRAFPETEPSGGIIEWDIQPLPHLQALLGERYGTRQAASPSA